MTRRLPSPVYFLAALGIIVGCTDSFFDRFQAAWHTELSALQATDQCGPGRFGLLVPDCPIAGICFTSACETHNTCYGTCGAIKGDCDAQFFQDLVSLCSSSLALTDPQYAYCRYLAVTYWVAVAGQGRNAFNITQGNACGVPPDASPPDQRGACCQAGSPTTCVGDVAFIDCTAQHVFVPDMTCEEVDSLLGGCPVPEHDACERAAAICEGSLPNTDLGRCDGDPDTQRGGGVCSISSQDCANGLACSPVEGEVSRCRVATDNRLAGTDGPQAGGACLPSGVDSFQADIWFTFVAPCSGTLTVRMCDQITYDAMLAVYGSGVPDAACVCPAAAEQLLACDDDFCGFAQTVSGLTVQNVVRGACYTIRVGGWSPDGTSAAVERGVSELDIGMFCP